MTHRHPVLDSAYPPGEESLAGALMMDVAIGVDDADDILTAVEELIDDGEFDDFYPDDEEPTSAEVRDLLERVIAVHNELVVEASPDRTAFEDAVDALGEQGVVTVLSGYTQSDAISDAVELAEFLRHEGEDVHGFVFSHRQDLQRVLETDLLYVGFGALSGSADDAAAVARAAVEAFRAAGLPVEWNGESDSRIVISPLRWAAPFEFDGFEDDLDDDEDDDADEDEDADEDDSEDDDLGAFDDEDDEDDDED